ncbi:hypothetical protein ASE07_03765 [Noviherbaspirillum sp. Root189]|nr:hypothetical protein ASE07_03765 [Noviherbaspirillum sp. Root189]
MKKHLPYVSLFLCALLILFVAYVNLDAITGAFGEGSPYFGRTTNMDKWENPVPMLVVVDVFTIVLSVVVGRWAVKQFRQSQ